ncbi:DUF485 domain-containing protein [Streptomyces antimycoticus]|uniref:DUF485 domain-containing protein n=1 Tax=Streptomyces antimycoticus TaxID=68175 RepID=UPI000A3A2A84|nr:DUF485 domain-containing protein [Streptomyces antimycoticus]
MNKSVRPPASWPSERATGTGFADRGDDIGEPDFEAIQQSPEFKLLRRRLLWFIFPMSAFFLCWYMTFVLFSAYAHDFMSRKLFGAVNTGTVFGLLQFVTTMAIVLTYRRFARKKLDPQVDTIHELAGVGKE